MPTTERLKYFLELSNHKTMIEAANALHISPAGLSISIKNLEKELDLQLLYRKRNEIIFTDNGKKLLVILGDFFSSIAALQTHSKYFSKEISGELNIYATEGTIYNALPVILPHIYNLFPNLKINLKHESYNRLISKVNQSEIPFAFLFQIKDAQNANLYPTPKNLCFKKLFDCQLLYHIPNRFQEFRMYSSLTSQDLNNYTLIYNLPKDENALWFSHNYVTSKQNRIFEENLALFTSYMENEVGIGQTIYSNYNKHLPYSFKNCYTLPSGDNEKISFCYIINPKYQLSDVDKQFLDFVTNFTSLLKKT
ncbi:MAG: LysR family transcriptional regulator [Peptococcaceae bacterium]|nr:LysR family transcriptional regulator [Peptococcaceae bacterium]